MTTNPEPAEQRPYWFVGASYGGTNDQTERFLREGIWNMGIWDAPEHERCMRRVNSMQPGDRIAIKATTTQKNGLPFAYAGKTASLMRIKATGTITENVGDGHTVKVDWSRLEPPREWYFYTGRSTVWEVRRGAERSLGRRMH